MAVRIVRSAQRFTTQREWSLTRHSFSFGGHDDPSNRHFGALVALNDERVEPGHGYLPHEHRGVDIVTWVIDGTLRHEDSLGTAADVGRAQLLSAGGGVVHAERSADHRPVHFVQMWLQTAEAGPPYHQAAPIDPVPGALTAVASGEGGGPLVLREPGASVWVGAGDVEIPAAPLVHLFAVRGPLALGDTVLADGDAARLTDHGPVAVRSTGGEVLVLLMGRPPA